jgi:pimeloyl-ACP methyl ester carboxylesterase
MFQPITYGKKPFNIALLHGGPGSPGNISILGQNLTQFGGVLQVKQENSSVARLLKNMDQQIRKNTTAKIVLVGHSFGAWISALYASQFKSQVEKIILIGMGPLKQGYAQMIHETRLKRLSSKDRKRYQNCLNDLNSFDVPRAKFAMRQLHNLTKITDYFQLINRYDFSPPVDLHQFQSLQTEITHFRESGKLIDSFKHLDCPISILHGEYDPHPLSGITDPLDEIKCDYNLHTFSKCGHEPWMEEQKCGKFFQVMEDELKGS